jgi:hypothetical protein
VGGWLQSSSRSVLSVRSHIEGGRVWVENLVGIMEERRREPEELLWLVGGLLHLC